MVMLLLMLFLLLLSLLAAAAAAGYCCCCCCCCFFLLQVKKQVKSLVASVDVENRQRMRKKETDSHTYIHNMIEADQT